MNSNKDLLSRVLQLFPIKEVKIYFNKKEGTAATVIKSIVETFSSQSIQDFILNHYLFSKQNVHIFKCKRSLNLFNLNNAVYPSVATKDVNDWQKILWFHKVKYTVILQEPVESEVIYFLQPIIIAKSGDKLLISAIKIDKKPTSYFPETRMPVKAGKGNEHEGLEKAIGYFVGNPHQASPIDLNKGVKALWEANDVDSRTLQYRGGNSVNRVIMDEQLTFKQIYPDEYQEIIDSPLIRTAFKYLKNDDYLCDTFEIDPSGGILNIPRFSKNINQVENVIAKIFENNR